MERPELLADLAVLGEKDRQEFRLFLKDIARKTGASAALGIQRSEFGPNPNSVSEVDEVRAMNEVKRSSQELTQFMVALDGYRQTCNEAGPKALK